MTYAYTTARPRADRSTRLNAWSDFPEEAFARSYIKLGRQSRPGYRMLAREIARIAPAPAAVLDIATGPGYLLAELARAFPGARVTGLDYSPTMVAHAEEVVASRGLADRVSVVQGDALEMPLPDASFDLAVTTAFLHQLDDLAPLFGEAKRVLAPGGMLVADAFRRDVPEWLYRLAWLHTRYVHARGQALDGGGVLLDASWTAEEVRSALLAAGFADARVECGLARLKAFATR